MTVPAQRRLALAMSEAELQAAVTDLADTLGLYWHHNKISLRSRPGWPDLVLLGTSSIFAELKSEAGRLSVDQRRVGSKLQRAGLTWVCWRPTEWLNGTIYRRLLLISGQPALPFDPDAA